MKPQFSVLFPMEKREKKSIQTGCKSTIVLNHWGGGICLTSPMEVH